MPDGVLERLRQYRAEAEALAPPIEIEEIALQRTGSGWVRPVVERARQRPRRWPAWAIAGAGFGLAIAVGVAALLLRGGTAPQSDTVAPSITSTTAASASPLRVEELVWYRVPYDETVFEEARVGSVTVLEGGLVAVGEDVDGAAAWISLDGLTWTRVSRNDAPFGGRFEAVVQGGPGLVGVGGGRVYASADGTEWTAARCPDCAATGEFGYVADVAAGGSGLVAVGNATDEGTGDAFFWTSPDGLIWTRVNRHEAVEMESVTAGGPGFVAVGHSAGRAVVLTSPDGTDWSRLPDDDEIFGGSLMRSVVAIGDGVVALGEWSWGGGQAWTSRDGVVWTRVPYEGSMFRGSSIRDAVVFGDRLIVIGDSSFWIAAPPGSIDPTAIAATDPSPRSQFAVTGEPVSAWQKTEITTPWASGIVDVTSLPGGGFAVVASRGGSVLWSRDGVSWQETDPDGLTAPSGWRAAEDARLITALPGRIAVLSGATRRDPVVWVGDLATSDWGSIPLDTSGLTDISEDQVAIASSDHDVLVVAGARVDPDGPDGLRYVVWLIDPETGQVDRSILPSDFPGFISEYQLCCPGLEVDWSGVGWVLAVGDTVAVSGDGLAWTFRRDDDRVAADAHWVTSLSVGPDAIIATTCGGWGPHLVWYSEDGLDWIQAPNALPGPHSGYAYSSDLGFVVVEDGRVFVSNDGKAWHWTLGPGWEQDSGDAIAASGDTIFVVADPPFLLTAE